MEMFVTPKFHARDFCSRCEDFAHFKTLHAMYVGRVNLAVSQEVFATRHIYIRHLLLKRIKLLFVDAPISTTFQRKSIVDLCTQSFKRTSERRLKSVDGFGIRFLLERMNRMIA